MLEEPLDTNIVEFSVTESAISELREKYMPLTINGIEDKQGYKIVSAARKVIKAHRVDIEKRRKELTASALDYQRRIMSEAKRVTALLEPIEDHLENQEKAIDAEIQAIKDEQDRVEREKLIAQEKLYLDRVKKINELGFIYNGVNFVLINKYDNSEMFFLSDKMKSDSEEDFLENYLLAIHFSDSIKSYENEEKAKILKIQEENERLKRELLETQELARRDAPEKRNLALQPHQCEEELQISKDECLVDRINNHSIQQSISDDLIEKASINTEQVFINEVTLEFKLDKLLSFVKFAASIEDASIAALLPIDARELLNDIGETNGNSG